MCFFIFACQFAFYSNKEEAVAEEMLKGVKKIEKVEKWREEWYGEGENKKYREEKIYYRKKHFALGRK